MADLIPLLKRVSSYLFKDLAEKYSDSFEGMRQPLSESGFKILFRTYISIIMFLTALTFIVSLPLFFLAGLFLLNLPPLQLTAFTFLGSIGAASIIFTLAYLYPTSRAGDRQRNIDANLPFAVNHMAAIATSGVPPTVIFKLLAEFGEYEEVSKECGKIVRNVESFGQDVTTAIDQVAEDVPSDEFQELLYGMTSIIETGGNLDLYLQDQAQEALFQYRIRREEYAEALSTYADFYTAVLIAAPLFLISILAVINIIGGDIAGYDINTVLTLGIFVGIPLINSAFLGFIHVTQPEQV